MERLNKDGNVWGQQPSNVKAKGSTSDINGETHDEYYEIIMWSLALRRSGDERDDRLLCTTSWGLQ